MTSSTKYEQREKKLCTTPGIYWACIIATKPYFMIACMDGNIFTHLYRCCVWIHFKFKVNNGNWRMSLYYVSDVVQMLHLSYLMLQHRSATQTYQPYDTSNYLWKIDFISWHMLHTRLNEPLVSLYSSLLNDIGASNFPGSFLSMIQALPHPKKRCLK